MKRLFTIAAGLLIYISASAQGGTWVWVKGGQGFSQNGVFGTQGVPGVANTPQSYYEACTWIDLEGKLWIFGGVDSNSAEGNDFWKFDPVSNNWTWMSGSGGQTYVQGFDGTKGMPSPNNYPSATGWGAMTWTDLDGNFWLMGGNGPNTIDQLWKYDISTSEWTWMTGSDTSNGTPVYGIQGVPDPANTPGGRTENNSNWVDAQGHLWLFGGMGINFGGYYNDVWEYDPATNNWTWVAGPQGLNNEGYYGTLGLPGGGVPPARACYTHWKDAAGNFYIFGGARGPQLDSSYRDIWKFSPASKLWTWIGGDAQLNAPGNYQGLCNYSGYYGPGGRTENRTAQVTGCTNSFISFGGYPTIFEYSGGITYYDNPVYNDLWLYNTSTGGWKWLSGTDTLNSLGNYGTMGVASPANMIPGRSGQSQWLDQNGVLWIFGGLGDIVLGPYLNRKQNQYNDIWKFIPDPNCLDEIITAGLVAHVPASAICRGDSVKLTLSGNTGAAVISPSTGVFTISDTVSYVAPKVTTTYTIVAPSGCSSSDTARVTIQVLVPSKLDYWLADTTICSGDTDYLGLYFLTNPQISPASYIWGDPSHTYAKLFPDVATNYTVTGQSSVCAVQDTVNFTIHVTPYAPFNISLQDSILCTGDSVYLSISGLYNILVSYSWDETIIDSAHYFLKPYGTSTILVSGTTSCGSNLNFPINLYVTDSTHAIFTISDSVLCVGDTGLFSLVGLAGAAITPSTGITWIDSSHCYISPAQTTRYLLTGNTLCGKIAQYINIYVQKPGAFVYYLNDSSWCPPYNWPILEVFGSIGSSISPAASSSYQFGNEYEYEFYVDTTTTYTVTDTSACGYTATMPLTIYGYKQIQASFSDSMLCPGDSAILTVGNLSAVKISPTGGVAVLDSAHYSFKPDSTTTYIVSGFTLCGPDTIRQTIHVNRPGVLDYLLSPDSLCIDDRAFLTVYSVPGQLSISPQTGVHYNTFNDSTYYYYFQPNQTTTYHISGNSVCGYVDSVTFTIAVDGTWNLTNQHLCNGDSALLSFSGLQNVIITPDSGFSWRDSSHLAFYNSKGISYSLTALNACGHPADYSFTIQSVDNISWNYYLFDSAIYCSSDHAELDVNNWFDDIEISPQNGVNALSSDYFYLSPDTTTTYTLTANDECDTFSWPITVTVNQYGPLIYYVDNLVLCNWYSAATLTIYGGFYDYDITPAGYDFMQYDSTIDIYPYGPVSTFHVVAYTSCGIDTADITIISETPGVVPYALSDSVICQGSSTQLTIYQLDGAKITPSTGVTWLGPAHVIFNPSVTTTYQLTGVSSCGDSDTAVFVIHVDVPGHPIVSIDSDVCFGTYPSLKVLGLANVIISPALSWEWNYQDSTQATFYGTLTSPLSFQLTGVSGACGTNDTVDFTLRNLSYFSLSKQAFCAGDTAVFSFTGLSNFRITPDINMTWQTPDSTLLYIYPDTNTNYKLMFYTECGYADSQSFSVLVSKPGKLNWTTTGTLPLCYGNELYLNINNATKIKVSPAPYYNNYGRVVLNPDSTTTYLLTDTSTVCGTDDTASLIVPVIPYNPIAVTVTDTPLCLGDTVVVKVSGGGALSVQSNYWDNNQHTVVDSALVYLYPSTTNLYNFSVATSCGSWYNFNIPVTINQPDPWSVSFNNTQNCEGDTGYLVTRNLTHINITPFSNITWLAPDSAIIVSDTSTTYLVAANTSCGTAYQYLAAYVPPRAMEYVLADTVQCARNDDFLYIGNQSNSYSDLTISPAAYATYYGTYYAYLHPDTTTTFTVSAMICNKPDTQQFTVLVVGTKHVYYTLSNTTICAGDTDVLKLLSTDSVIISPSTYTDAGNLNHIKLFPPVTTAYTVISHNMCNSYDTIYFTVQVNKPGTAVFTLSKNRWCGDDSATLSLAGYSGIMLTPVAGVRWIDSAHAVLHPIQSTTYTASAINLCGNNFDSVFTILVHSASGTTVNIEIPDTLTCFDKNVTLVASTTAYQAKYTWSTGGTDSALTITTPGNYTVIVTDTVGCTASSAQSVFQNITAPGVSISGGSILSCGNKQLVLSGTSTDADAALSWGVSDLSDSLVVLLPGIYSITATDTLNGCTSRLSDTITGSADSILFQLNIKPTSCGLNNGFVSVISAGTLPNNFLWNTGSTRDSVTSLFAGTYRVTVTNNAGCSATARAVVDSSISPAVNIATGAQSICPGASTSICASSGFASYWWNAGFSDSCMEAAQPGSYYVTVTDNNGCTAISNTIHISVYEAPPVSTTLRGDTVRAYNAVRYQWYFNGNLLPGETDSILIAPQAGTYVVVTWDSNGCTAISNGILVKLTGITSLQQQLSIKLFPDPATDELNISYILYESTALRVSISDLAGKQVAAALNEKELRGDYLKHVNISHLAPGVYLVNFAANNGQVNLRFVKE